MKEISLKAVIGQDAAGFDKTTRTKAITEAVVRRVDRQTGEGSYFAQIPEQFQPTIREMVVFNVDDLTDPRQGEKVLEQMSRSWLVRQRVIPHIMERAGFTDITTLRKEPDNTELHKSTIAAITEKATVLLVGKGGLRADGEGTAVSWNPLPEREKEPEYVPNLEKGARIMGAPKINESLEVRYNERSERTYDYGNAAPLIKVFTGPGTVSIRDVEAQIAISDNHMQQLRKKKME